MSLQDVWGPLALLTSNPHITEIMVNGPEQIFVEENGVMKKTELQFVDEHHLRRVIDRLVAEVGRRVDLASPLCDARLADGSRLNVVLPPISLQGPVLTIRRFRQDLLTMDNLCDRGSISLEQRDVLVACVRSRKNLIVAGNTGSGKTTLLNILSSCIDDHERIVTLEDTAELRLQKSHVIRLETRPANAEGKGQMTMADLVVNALRMRPDRLIVGECRGAEILPMLQAMNTGHHGSMTTLHANSAADALQRLQTLILSYAPEWPMAVVRQQLLSALDGIVYLHRSDGHRQCQEISGLQQQGEQLGLVPLTAL